MKYSLLMLLAACSHASAPAPAPIAAPTGAPSKSHLDTLTFHSNALGVDKHVVVYVPAGYDSAPAKRWPVMYYLHGLGGSETDWTKMGHLEEAADAMQLGALVVMPDGDNNFYIDSAMPEDYDACMKDGKGMFVPLASREDTCVHASKYATYIVDDLVGWVDGKFRTIAARDGRGIAGLSMGGFGALELGMRFSDKFAVAASHSGVDALLFAGPFPYTTGHLAEAKQLDDVSKWGADTGALGDWIRLVFGPERAQWAAVDPGVLAQSLPKGKLALYLDCGTEDGFGLNNQATYLHDVLTSRGIDHEFFLGPGGHDFGFWKDRVPHSLAFLRDHLTAAK